MGMWKFLWERAAWVRSQGGRHHAYSLCDAKHHVGGVESSDGPMCSPLSANSGGQEQSTCHTRLCISHHLSNI